jgi:cytochrome P450
MLTTVSDLSGGRRGGTVGAMALPPGPSVAKPVQTVRMLVRPVALAEECRDRYGGTFRMRLGGIGDVVFISDPPSMKRLFGADRVNTIAPGRNVVLRPILGPRSLLLLQDDEHLRRRKLILPPFHGERMRAYEAVIESATEREISSWPQQREFRLHPRMQSITLEVIIRAVFGVGEQRREELRRRLLAILAATRSPRAMGLTMPVVRGAFRRLRKTLEETDELLAAEIAERRADPEVESREDILSLLVAARDEQGEGMSDAELRDQLMTLLMAGHETTATALAWAFDLLFRHPAAMERLRREIADGGSEYMDAVIEESLRVRPVVPFTGRQLREPAELGGYELPAGTIVLASIYLTHTNPDAFPEPRQFRPERFLGEGPETYSWIPFGGGTRRCIGAAFAQFEMAVVLRAVLRSAVLRPARPEPEPIVRRNVTFSPRNGTPAVLERRLAAKGPEPAAVA